MEMPILLALNKQDLPNAKKQNIIEEELIKEMWATFFNKAKVFQKRERTKLSRKSIAEENEDFDDFLKV